MLPRSLRLIIPVLCLFVFEAFPVHAQQLPSSADLHILRMANGEYYHPATGLRAASETLLIELVQTGQAPSRSGGPPPSVATDLPVSSSVTSTQSLVIAPPPIKDVLDRARELLLAEKDVQTGTIVPEPLSTAQVHLAVWNEETNDLFVTVFQKSGTVLKNIDRKDIGLKVVRTNGINSEYAFSDPRLRAVMVKYPTYVSVSQGKKTAYKIQEVTYVPYSPGLHRSEVVEWGKQTLDGYVDDTIAHIRSLGVRSHAFPDALLADSADPVVMKSILAIEHLESWSLQQSSTTGLERFYVTLALNQGQAYAYARSSAGALGLLQFIPSTYANTLKRWPNLDLNPDFEKGMRDPRNAIMAQIAYLDEVWLDLPKGARDVEVTPAEVRREYAVAAYNAGGVRVRRAINEQGDDWDTDLRARQNAFAQKQSALKKEIAALQKKVNAAQDAASKKKLTAQLRTTKNEYADVTERLQTLDRSRLKAETLDYLNKHRLILPLIGPEVASVGLPAQTAQTASAPPPLIVSVPWSG